MYIHEYERNSLKILELDGRLDGDGSVELEQVLQRLCDGTHQTVVLDLLNVNYVNSGGLRVLARFLKISREKGCEMRLCNLTANVQRAMDMVGLIGYFQPYETLHAAMAI